MTKKQILLIDALISIVVVLVGFNAVNHFEQGSRNETL
jgi:hypothetical protein